MSCVLLEGGVVKCWGRNDLGQLGQGDTTSRGATPESMGNALATINLGADRTAKQLRVGTTHACAILDNNQLKCWGSNGNGMLGTGDTTGRGTSVAQLGESLPAVDLGTGRSAKAVALGLRHTCAILDTNQVKCWGFHGNGALGLGDSSSRFLAGSLGDNLPTVNLGAGRTAKAIAAGSDFSCAILDTDQVKCWGSNAKGQLGQGHVTNLGTSPEQMGDALLPIDLGAGRTVRAIALAQWAACALLDNGRVKCWGNNDVGQLGQGTTNNIGDGPNEMGAALLPIELGANRTVTAISAKQSTVCAVLDTNQVKCWGWNNLGQLGLGDVNARGDQADEMGDQLQPVLLGTSNPATGVSVGTNSACATLLSRRLKCWGSNSDGALGVGNSTQAALGDTAGELGNSLPYVNLGSKGIQAVSSGNDFSCALLNDGKVKCWGSSAVGQLGLGDRTTRGDGPNEMGAALAPLQFRTASPVRQLASRYGSSCIVTVAGELECWGSNTTGELGLGHRSNIGDDSNEMGSNLPLVDLGAGVTVKSVAIGGGFACAILNDNRIKCWGRNEHGELGQGDVQARGDDPAEMGAALPFVNLGTGRTVKKLALGTDHACAILDTNQVKCWGWNSAAQLGLGDVLDRGEAPNEMGDALPVVALGTGRSALDITAGAFHTCVLLDNAKVKCWGYNGNGAAGWGDHDMRGNVPGTMGDALPYVDLGTDRSVKSVTATIFGTCAILDNDLVKCWGRNGVPGTLGLGDTRDRGANPGEMGDALPAVFLGPGRSVTSVTGGNNHGCALLTTGELKCWGKNTTGQLGIGDTNDRGDTRSEASTGYDAVDLGAE